MAFYGQVRQFVDDDVFKEIGRQHDGPPVESQRAVGGAASPAAALVADDDPRNGSCAKQGPPVFYASLKSALWRGRSTM